MKPERTETLFNEAFEIIKQNAQKDPENAYNWFDLLDDGLSKYSAFDNWCLEKYGMPANEYLLNNGIIRNRDGVSDGTNAMNLENAIIAYQNAIQALHDECTHTYTDYIVGDAKVIGGSDKICQYDEESILSAHTFFTELDICEGEQTYVEKRDQVLKDILDKNDFYWVMEGIVEPEISIAVVIAYVLFFDTAAATYLEFLRDKWEYRGDMHKDPIYGGRWLYFCYSSETQTGEVAWRYKNKGLTFGWEIEKADKQRRRDCQQMISQNIYDEVESLDINNKKILFLTDYSVPGMRFRCEEQYKYVAGSMICLFNYACSYVGSIEAKPDFIIIDQSSVTREDLQSAIIYKKLNPTVKMLELGRFVELLEKVDLKKIKKDKPAITKAELDDDCVFGAPLDKPQGESLKEYSRFTFGADLEVIKAAKHISIPEDCTIKDKSFVFSGSNRKNEDKVKKAGGVIKKSVSSKTDYYVIDLRDSVNERLCEQANALFDKGKGDNLHIITPRILNKMLKG